MTRFLDKLVKFCETVGRYDGPQETEAVQTIDKFEYEERTTAYARAFELGYKRGYADAAQYVAEWIDEEGELDGED